MTDPRPLRVWALPPIWGTPSPSPFAIKLMTWLRMAGLPYETALLTRPPRSATGKVPYVELPDGALLHDSGLIIEALSRSHGIDLDQGLSAADRALGHAVRRMLEEHLYFVGLYERWLLEEGYACTARDYFRHMPPVVRHILPAILRRRIRRYLHGQGLSRHPPEVIAQAARADLDALAALLGDKEFLLGPPSTVDATACGVLWAMSAHPFPSPLRDAIEARPTLLSYRDRLRARYWGEWAGGVT